MIYLQCFVQISLKDDISSSHGFTFTASLTIYNGALGQYQEYSLDS